MQKEIIKARKKALGVALHKVIDVPAQGMQGGYELIRRSDVVRVIAEALAPT